MENKRSNVFDWFSKNYLKINPDKLNLLLTSTERNSMKIEGCSTSKKLLGASIDVSSILLNYFFYSIEGYRKASHHVLLDLKLRVDYTISCENVYNWKGNRFSSFRSKFIRTWCKSGSRTPGPGTPSKFKSSTRNLPKV